MKALVGYTGFVGSNIAAQTQFDRTYHSKNIQEAYGTNPDLLVYAGIRAEKYVANNFPQKDKEVIREAIENIKKIRPKQIVLISTIDVYKEPSGVTEDHGIDTNSLLPYGYHRYLLEQWVEDTIENHLIVRLPGLYGKNIKKNFIFDYIHRIPTMLKPEKFTELVQKEAELQKYYTISENGFYICHAKEKEEKRKLRKLLEGVDFDARFFTDSRGVFQFYNLAALWKDMQMALELGISKINLAPQPVKIAELYEYLSGETFVNEINQNIPFYNFKSKYAQEFGGENGYMTPKETVLKQIKEFTEYEISHL